jgi:membrane protease YdiL (CAAX protease family)
MKSKLWLKLKELYFPGKYYDCRIISPLHIYAVCFLFIVTYWMIFTPIGFSIKWYSVFIAPIWEEFVFRVLFLGLPLVLCKNHFKSEVMVIPLIISNSFIFALLHGAQAFLPVFILSVIICTLFVLDKRNLFFPIIIHMLNNFVDYV